MAAYSIFIPGATGANANNFARVGLDNLVTAEGTEWADIISAPFAGGAHGSVATWRPHNDPALDSQIGIHSSQRWEPAKADPDRDLEAERFWIGWEEERPPSPSSLARREQFAGGWARLRDGQSWQIPAAAKLPHKHKLDAESNFVRVIEARFADYYSIADSYMQQIFTELDLRDYLETGDDSKVNDNPVPVKLSDAWRFCCLALGLNYKLTPEVIDVLELLDDRSMVAIIYAAIDLIPIIECREQKKTDYYPVGIPLG